MIEYPQVKTKDVACSRASMAFEIDDNQANSATKMATVFPEFKGGRY